MTFALRRLGVGPGGGLRWLGLAIAFACISDARALDAATHDRLIEAARRGEVAFALDRFESELARSAKPPARLLHDTIVLNVWAERHARALELADRLSGEPPNYVQGALALALRRSGRFADAIVRYRALLVREPGNADLAADLLYTLVEAQRLEEASREVDARLPRLSAERSRRSPPALLLAAAHVREREGRLTEALALLLDAEPTAARDEVRRRLSLVLTRLGAPSLALAHSRAVEHGKVPFDERERLEQNETARRIGYGEVQLTLDLGLARFARTDDALARNAADLSRVREGDPLHQNALFDRMLAARDRVRMNEVIELERRASELGYTLPPYALAAAADAWLYLREPEKARDRYLKAFEMQRNAGQPETLEWRYSLIYAYLEAEQWKEAFDLARALVAEIPPERDRGFGPDANPDYIRAHLQQAVLERFGERLWSAAEKIDRLREAAPHHPSVRDAHASMLARHDFVEEARDEWLRLRADTPDALWPRISVADMEFRLDRPDRAAPYVAELAREYPEHRGVQRLIEEEKAFHAPRLRLSAVLSGRFDEDSPNRYGEPDLRAYLRADTPLLANRWRLYFDGFLSWEELDRQAGRRERGGVGVDYRFDGLHAWGLLHRDRRPNAKDGWALGFGQRVNDRWAWRAFFDTNSTDIALRASLADIHARQLHVSLRYQGRFERRFGLGFDTLRFDDGNRRRVLSGSWFELWQSEPRWRIEGLFSLGGSTNTRRDAPYFNPEADAWLDYTLTGQWLTWRHYTTSFKQRLHGILGAYWQKGYGTLPVLGLKYEHEWEEQRRWVLRYGVGLTRRPYDGNQETRWLFYLDAGWKPWW